MFPTRTSDSTHLIKMASLILNGPGLRSTLNTVLPRRMNFSLAIICPSGYVASITKYALNDGALDLK